MNDTLLLCGRLQARKAVVTCDSSQVTNIFGHHNIIDYCNRPFVDVHEMNVEMVRRHNEVVGPDDEVYHLGDFALRDEFVDKYLARLNGRHHLVMGNHDKCYPTKSRAARATRNYLKAGFLTIQERMTLTLEGLGEVLLCHLPLRMGSTSDWNDKYYKSRPTIEDLGLASPVAKILLHGHVHERWKRRGYMVNVGVDVWDFRPVSEPDLVRFIQSDENATV